MEPNTTYELVAIDEHGAEQGRYPVATVPFCPADVLVVRVDGNTPIEEVMRLRQALYTMFPPDRVLIVRSTAVSFLRLEAKG